MKNRLLITLGILVLNTGMAQTGPFQIEFEQLAPGVWTGVRPDSQRFPVMGSTTFVIGGDGVVVFDGGGVPVMAEKVISKIRSETELPVTHVIISHWRDDHNFGIHRFAEEFPGVQFIAHEFTHAAMNGSPIDYINSYKDFVEQSKPRLQERVDSGVDGAGKQLSEAALVN